MRARSRESRPMRVLHSAYEEAQGSAHLCGEGDGGVGPDLGLHPHVGRGEAVEEHEQMAAVRTGMIIRGTSEWVSKLGVFLRNISINIVKYQIPRTNIC